MLPEYAIAVLARRRAAARESSNGAVLPTRNRTWHQDNNVERRWRLQIRMDTGLERITSHTYRKTVGTLISPRVDPETASQQLGHSSPAIRRESYLSKPVATVVLLSHGAPRARSVD